MSKKTYRVMEWHRGELVPIMTKDKNGKKVEKTVFVDEQSADELNRDFSSKVRQGSKIKYVLKEENSFEYEKAKKPELIDFLVKNEIEHDETEKVDELRKKIEKFLGK